MGLVRRGGTVTSWALKSPSLPKISSFKHYQVFRVSSWDSLCPKSILPGSLGIPHLTKTFYHTNHIEGGTHCGGNFLLWIEPMPYCSVPFGPIYLGSSKPLRVIGENSTSLSCQPWLCMFSLPSKTCSLMHAWHYNEDMLQNCKGWLGGCCILPFEKYRWFESDKNGEADKNVDEPMKISVE